MPSRLNLSLLASMSVGLMLAAAFPFGSAHAQVGNAIASGSILPVKKPDLVRGSPSETAPAALPGSRPNSDRVTPSSGPNAAMSPNDALFDAINRGDIADARDAVTRGADLGARNILGLTAIDLAVDLSRNDITMWLLSLRGASSGRSGPAVAAASAGADRPSKPLPAAAVRPPPPRMAAAAKTLAADPPVKRQLASTNPGTPAPQVGFLGFGGAPHQ